MTKRVLSLILAVLTLFALCAPAFAADEPAPAATSGKCGPNVTWSIANGTLTISGTGKMDDFYFYDIPEASIHEAPWWSASTSFSKVVIKSGVTSIGEWAFASMMPNKTVTSVTIPSTVKTIGGSAFLYCAALKSVKIPEGVTSIGEQAFRGCTSLTSVTIPKSLTEVDINVFADAPWLEDQLSSGKMVIAGNVLLGYQGSARSLTIPNSVTSIGGGAFAFNCPNLASVTIPSSVKIIGRMAFMSTAALTSIKIPSSVTSIGQQAFQGCGLTSVDIPSSVKFIGGMTFSFCEKLKTVTIRNPKCEIEELDEGMPAIVEEGVTIQGYDGSTAQTYAKAHGLTFKSLGKAPSGGTTPKPTPAPSVKNGMITENGKTYYYKNGVKQKGLQTISGAKYYFSAKDGHRLTGLVNIGGGKLCYFSAKNGKMLTGLVNVGGHICYFSAKDGHRLTGLVNVGGGHICYFSAKTGYRLTGLVTTDAKGTQRYFSVKTGYMMTNGWYNTGSGRLVQVNANGVVIAKKGF